MELTKSAYEVFNKNQRVYLFSIPFPIEDLPPGKKVLRPVWVLKIVQAAIDTYNLKLRLAVDGSLQQKGVDYDHSWLPTPSALAFRTTIMWAANQRLTLAVLDIENCFQNTIIE